jgi:hypothetical protein
MEVVSRRFIFIIWQEIPIYFMLAIFSKTLLQKGRKIFEPVWVVGKTELGMTEIKIEIMIEHVEAIQTIHVEATQTIHFEAIQTIHVMLNMLKQYKTIQETIFILFYSCSYMKLLPIHTLELFSYQ